MTRSQLIGRTALAAGAVVAGGALAAPAFGAEDEQDLAWVQFGVSLSFLTAVVHRRARRSGLFTGGDLRSLDAALSAEEARTKRFVELLAANGQPVISGEDLEITLPADAFASRGRVASIGRRVTGIGEHAYIGAAAGAQSVDMRLLFARSAASAAEQLAFYRGLTATAAVGGPFPGMYDIARASDELGVFLP
ncbi:MAG: hypothetical protein AB7V42_16320 [Thermoleophilia bacterium]